jgi:DNA/RNA-binding domain of Phe-tRNA-synthetase-like protein
VAIYGLLQQSAFGPDEISRIVAAYEDCLAALGVSDSSDPRAEALAKRILMIAQTGERDPVQLKSRALRDLGLEPPQ